MKKIINGVEVTYENEQDYSIVETSYKKILQLFGNDRRKKIEDAISQRVGIIIIHPANYSDDVINSNTPGKTNYVGDINSKVRVRVSPKGTKKQGEHYVRHEMVHAFSVAARDAFSTQQKEGVVNGIPLFRKEVFNGSDYQAVMGNIYKANYSGGANVQYGAGFCEIMTDLFAIISDISQDEEKKRRRINANTIINESINKWNVDGITTGYLGALPLIRLTIAAFSNFPQPDYQHLLDTGNGLFGTISVADGKDIVPINDFLYGSMYDPFHIKKVFDDIMGEGVYFKFCELFDNIINTFARHQNPSKEHVEFIIKILNIFMKGNVEKKINNNMYSEDYGNGIIENYKNILSIVQMEYGLPLHDLEESINQSTTKKN